MPDHAQRGLCARVSRTGDTATIWFTGEIDCGSLGTACAAICEAGDASRNIIFDLSGVTFCDCAGVHLLLGVRNRLRAAGGEVTARGPNPVVRRVLELTRTLAALCPGDPAV